jgi:thiol-disulfide isomerase/thioredoxin
MRAGFVPAILLSIALATGACDKGKEAAPQAEAKAEGGRLVRDHAGGDAPATPFLGPDDGPVALSNFRGRPLLVNLWATWCAPCVAEMPALDRLAQAQKPDGLQVLVVSQDMGGRNVVTPFFQKMKFAVLQPYLDKEMLIGAALGARGLPVTVLFDAEGKEVWRVEGPIDWTGAEAARLLKEAAPDKS